MKWRILSQFPLKLNWYIKKIKNKVWKMLIMKKESFSFNFFTFFYTHKKKVLGSRKFSTSGFRWIYMFWDVLNKIWPFLESVCLSVSTPPKFCGHCITRTNGWILMKFNIKLHIYVIWSSLDFGVYRLRSFNVIWNFWFL